MHTPRPPLSSFLGRGGGLTSWPVSSVKNGCLKVPNDELGVCLTSHTQPWRRTYAPCVIVVTSRASTRTRSQPAQDLGFTIRRNSILRLPMVCPDVPELLYPHPLAWPVQCQFLVPVPRLLTRTHHTRFTLLGVGTRVVWLGCANDETTSTVEGG